MLFEIVIAFSNLITSVVDPNPKESVAFVGSISKSKKIIPILFPIRKNQEKCDIVNLRFLMIKLVKILHPELDSPGSETF